MNNQSEDRVLGYVGTYPVGDYNEQTEYEYLNVVTHKGSSYVCIKEEGCIAVEPPNEECWQLFAGKGDTGEKGEKGDIGPTGPKPVNGVDYNTNAEREEFKNAVVADSKADLEKYITEKETHLDNYTKEKEIKLDDYVTDTVKPVIDTYVTDITKKDIDAYEKEKEKVLDTYTDTKKTEIDNYVTNTSKPALDKYEKDKEAELETAKNTAISEYDAHAETLTNRIADLEEENSELVQQMPWNTTEIQESIHVEDTARYSKNKLNVLGNLTQTTREGINLINTSEQLNNTVNGITKINNKDGSLTLTGTATAEARIQLRTGTLEEGKYTYKCFGNQTDCVTNIYYIGNVTKENIRVFTASADSTKNYVFMYVIPEGTTINVTIKPMLVKGEYTSNTFPNFEQYGAMPSIEYSSMPVVATGLQKIKKIGKNFIPYPYAENSKSTYGIQYTVNKDGSIAVSGTSTNPACDFYLYGSSTDTGEYLHIKKGTYSIADTNIYNILYIAREKTLGALVGVTKIKQALASQDCYFYGYFLRVEKDITVNATFYPQLELNDTETFYEPYNGEEIILDLGTTELCKITDQDGNVVAQDRAVYRKVDGVKKWQWEKNVYKDSLTNLNNRSPLIITSYLANNLYGIVFNSIEKHKMFGQVIAIVCDKLKAKFLGSGTNTTDTNSVRNVEGIALHSSNNNQICITLEKTRLESEDLEGVRNFIRVNNITFYYPILVPVYVDCTETQSAVLDKLYKLSLEKGTNNIFVESENGVTTELQLEYMQNNNLKKEQENKALEDRITAIENLLSTTETSALLLDNMQTDLESEVE